eukprot:g40334.t1
MSSTAEIKVQNNRPRWHLASSLHWALAPDCARLHLEDHEAWRLLQTTTLRGCHAMPGDCSARPGSHVMLPCHAILGWLLHQTAKSPSHAKRPLRQAGNCQRPRVIAGGWESSEAGKEKRKNTKRKKDKKRRRMGKPSYFILIFTMDVQSLYTCIPHADGLK